jgi:hypothetical protein
VNPRIYAGQNVQPGRTSNLPRNDGVRATIGPHRRRRGGGRRSGAGPLRSNTTSLSWQARVRAMYSAWARSRERWCR